MDGPAGSRVPVGESLELVQSCRCKAGQHRTGAGPQQGGPYLLTLSYRPRMGPRRCRDRAAAIVRWLSAIGVQSATSSRARSRSL